MGETVFAQLPQALLPWYARCARDLPWRQDREPYHVWLSEVMLQQTRVEAVKRYYERFIKELPTVGDLARCPDSSLEKLWEGLGYYSRMRNLKKAAQVIQEQYQGRFPNTYGEIRALPGVGDYTAGAVCSIAFDLPTPAVDGNVMRVVSRLTQSPDPIDMPAARERVRRELAEVYPPQAGAFTQALMELGATLCGPSRAADCPACPCRAFCAAAIHDSADLYPVRSPKKEKRRESRTVLIMRREDGAYALVRRPDRGLLAGMWQFPDTEGTLEPQQAAQMARRLGLKVHNIFRQTEKKHIFTHIVWQMRGFYLEVEGQGSDLHWLSAQQIDAEAGLPTAYRQFWEEIHHV